MRYHLIILTRYKEIVKYSSITKRHQLALSRTHDDRGRVYGLGRGELSSNFASKTKGV